MHIQKEIIIKLLKNINTYLNGGGKEEGRERRETEERDRGERGGRSIIHTYNLGTNSLIDAILKNQFRQVSLAWSGT